MSSIPQTTADGNSVSDFATKFMKRFHLGKLLFKCNAGKEKGIPVMDIFRFLFCMMFSDRSVYMQMKTGTFEGGGLKEYHLPLPEQCPGKLAAFHSTAFCRHHQRLHETPDGRKAQGCLHC